MKRVIRFNDVSKRYSLGLTRTSLPGVISRGIRQLVRPDADSSDRRIHWALKNVSFELEKGQSLALIGPNGAGKSTILKLLAKITQPTSGNVEVDGKLSALIELGAGFHPDLTGRENIFLNGTILGLSNRDIRRRFDEIVSFAEVEDYIDTPVKRYSSGMTVRLGFAVASCIEPDILLVDEVLAVGDASFRLKCIERIKKLLMQETSLIFVSHDMGLVRAVCERGIHLEHGQVQHTGTSGQVIDLYNQVLEKRRIEKMRKGAEGGEETGGGVEITHIEVLDPAGKPITQTFGNQPAEIRVHYTAYRDMGRANAMIALHRSDGLRVCLMRTHLDGFSFELKQGQGFLSVKLEPLQLFGGMYYATSWMMDEQDADGLASGASDWFEVRNLTEGREAHASVYEPFRSWSHAGIPVPDLAERQPAARIGGEE